MDRKIYLVRHGKIDCGEKKRYIGTTDLPLCPEGLDQARKLKEFFEDIDIEKAYASPLERCKKTSEIILEDKKLECTVVEELKEIHMGTWEGKSFDYMKERFPEQFAYRGCHIDTFVPPMGESFEMLQKRLMPVVETIIKITAGNILIVAHAGVNRVILSKLLGFNLSRLLNVIQPYGCINELSWDDQQQKWQCETKNINQILTIAR
ncbi:MAG: alpha-ribazole phosphatase [Bacillota bacterium]|nr:alpha-ribazole phosphatase [Bacillota bacterium]MDP4154166.1 alpha-ribazole phosphatase [Bacillota bacterium]